jgi:hypothetical protein
MTGLVAGAAGAARRFLHAAQKKARSSGLFS